MNLVNGSTLAGLAVARLGGARVTRYPDGLLTGLGYRLPVPSAPAFTLGNVIITRRPALDADSALFRHEARHTTQYAWCGGLLMLPLYFTAAGLSWLLSGDVGAWNAFERRAGLADGGYTDWPLRWRATATSGSAAGASLPDLSGYKYQDHGSKYQAQASAESLTGHHRLNLQR